MSKNHQYPLSPCIKTTRNCVWIFPVLIVFVLSCGNNFFTPESLFLRGVIVIKPHRNSDDAPHAPSLHLLPDHGDQVLEITSKEAHTNATTSTANSPPAISSDPKPYLFLHVGPGKTGTTSTQCALQSLKNELLGDHFVIYNTHSCSKYKSTDIRATLYQCLRSETNGDPLPACIDFFLSDFRNMTKSRNVPQSIIISEESLHPVRRTFSPFVERLSEEYQVVIVATYRHVFERAVSYYTQTYKHLDQWPDHSTSSTKDILGFLRNELKRHEIDPFKQLTEGKLSTYSSLRVLNFHANPLVNNFICFGLAESPSACKKIRAQSKQEIDNAGTESYMFDSLAVEARKQLLIPKNLPLKRQEASALLAKRLKVSDFTKLPLICLSEEEIDDFWNITKGAATEVSKYNMVDGSSIDFKKLRAEFDKASTSGHWCRIDASKLLADESWRRKVALAFNPSATTVISKGETSKKITPTLSNHQKPYFVLHVGPGKTGTTSTQCALQSLKNELLRDHFVIYNTHSCSEYKSNDIRATLYQCLRETHGDPLPKCMDFYLSDFRNITKSGNSPQSIIISDEFLYPVPPMFTPFVERLNQEYQVVIIATYRHVFEYAVSYYTQTYKHLDQWPQPLLSESDGVLGFIRKELANHEIDPFKQLTEGKLSTYSSFRALNFHVADLVNNFICFGLPNAPSACKKVKAKSKKKLVNVGTEAYMFDSLAVEAKKQLLIPNKVSVKRQEASALLAKHLKTTDLARLPLICLSESERDDFWHVTEGTAKEVSKYKMVDGSSIDIQDLHTSFSKASASGLWCRIDAPKVLEDENWRKKVALALKNHH